MQGAVQAPPWQLQPPTAGRPPPPAAWRHPRALVGLWCCSMLPGTVLPVQSSRANRQPLRTLVKNYSCNFDLELRSFEAFVAGAFAIECRWAAAGATNGSTGPPSSDAAGEAGSVGSASSTPAGACKLRYVADENRPTPVVCEAAQCTATIGSPNITCAAVACACEDLCMHSECRAGLAGGSCRAGELAVQVQCHYQVVYQAVHKGVGI